MWWRTLVPRNVLPHTVPRRVVLVVAAAVLLVLVTSALAVAGALRPPAPSVMKGVSSQTGKGKAPTTHAAATSPTAAHGTGARGGGSQGSGRVPAGLPAHFSFGIMDSPGGTSYLNGMRSQNGTAWDYRYQYLSAGVNTGSGWSTWNQPAGAFATYYMQDSAANGYMPTFVYYMMLQSNGPSGSGEAGNDLAHLASPATMKAYYADWALLMQKIGAFGKPTLVIVEPDLWGYIEHAAVQAGTNSGASVTASVASSGFAGAAGFPNNAGGFAFALLHIRDLYAPNAVLALHASGWGTGIDLGSDTRTNLDVSGIAAQSAAFLKSVGLADTPAGVSTFDGISNDIADHDSGQSGNWWDRYNQTFPNFNRYLQYTSALAADTGRGILIWQVPVGNQYFDTENNSQGHTQDNKAEYILGHVADFARAGVIGVLFGPGNGGTTVQDARGDGVTNPAPISTYECSLCNNHTSTYADDDGGYLRIFVGQYYKSGGYPLNGGAPPAPPPIQPPTSATNTSGGASGPCAPTVTFGSGSFAPSSVAPGTTTKVTITLTASCQASALIDFEVYDAADQKAWQTWQDNASLTGASQTFSASWAVPAGQAAGTYTLKIGVFSLGWGTLYGWDNSAAMLTVS